MAADVEGKRLFLSAFTMGAIEVLDVDQRKHLHTIPKQIEPQGIVYLQDFDRVVIAEGGDGTVRKYDGGTYLLLQSRVVGSDPDNLRVGPVENHVLVGYGVGRAAGLAALSINAKVLYRVRLEGHPESFQVESNGTRIFVNVPETNEVAVVDRDSQSVIGRWRLGNARRNFAMALDEEDHRLFVLCRQPASLVVLNSRNGKLVARLPAVGDGDDIFYDSKLHRIYATGGEGAISVYAQLSADRYRQIAYIPTASGARTSLFVPAWNQLFVAAPERGNRKAEIRIYEPVP
jgi:DNA-binding beta-propeller fold protein YncE